MGQDEQRIVDTFCAMARPYMIRYLAGKVAECIACVRITEQVLGAFGIAVEPLPVAMAVSCDEKKFAFLSGIPAEERARLGVKSTPQGDRMRRLKQDWEGHLVALAGGRWLIDPTLDQASQPDRGFVIPTDGMFCLDVSSRSVPARDMAVDVKAECSNGLKLRVQYWPLDDMTYLTAPAWELDHITPAIRGITRALRERLEAAA
jgi:hypothetical protein